MSEWSPEGEEKLDPAKIMRELADQQKLEYEERKADRAQPMWVGEEVHRGHGVYCSVFLSVFDKQMDAWLHAERAEPVTLEQITGDAHRAAMAAALAFAPPKLQPGPEDPPGPRSPPAIDPGHEAG